MAALVVAIPLVGCAKHAILTGWNPAEAGRVPLSWEPNWKAEQYEGGVVHAELAGGERLEGRYIGYRLNEGSHCTRWWFQNIGHDLQTTVTPEFPLPRANGRIELKGDKGTGLDCRYTHVLPGCTRVGLCKSTDGRLYKIEF